MNYICPQYFQSAFPFHSVTDCEWNDLFSLKPSLSAASLNDLFSEMKIQNSWPNILDLQDELIENNIPNDAYITAEEAKLLLTPKSSSKIKSSLYLPYYAEACNELRGPSPWLSAWATQLRRNVATVGSRWQHCVDLTTQGIEPQTTRTDSVRLATELTADPKIFMQK